METYLIGLLSCWKLKERRDKCRDSWIRAARDLSMEVVFLIGVPELTEPERQGDLLLLSCPGDYDSLPQRTWRFCQWAIEHPDWTTLIKADDDTIFAADRLAVYERTGRDYIGARWAPFANYGSGGAGYMLSRKAAEIVAKQKRPLNGAEDVWVGDVMRMAGIPLSEEPRLIPFGKMDKRPKIGNDLLSTHACTEAFLACAAELAEERRSKTLQDRRTREPTNDSH